MICHKVTCFLVIVTTCYIYYAHGQSQQENLIDLNQYHSYANILRYIENMVRESPQKYRVHKIGRTYEGRDLVLVRASNNFSANNPVIMVDAGTHAREWASIAATLTLLEDIRQNTSGLLQYADWHIIPVVNPDGYEYSRNVDRYWRKNRAPNNKTDCLGTDLNRNYDFHWGESGVDFDPCNHELYPGDKPLSELESNAVVNVMKKYVDRTKLYATLHAYGNYMVYPYGYAEDALPRTWRLLDNFARNVTDEVSKISGERWHVMSSGQWYPGAGGSDDYAFGVVGIPYAYTIEITDGERFEYPEKKLDILIENVRTLYKAIGKLISLEFGEGTRYY